jgi:hypothetical protein
MIPRRAPGHVHIALARPENQHSNINIRRSSGRSPHRRQTSWPARVFALVDGVTDALEREWQRINGAANLGWMDKLTIVESGIARFQRRQPCLKFYALDAFHRVILKEHVIMTVPLRDDTLKTLTGPIIDQGIVEAEGAVVQFSEKRRRDTFAAATERAAAYLKIHASAPPPPSANAPSAPSMSMSAAMRFLADDGNGGWNALISCRLRPARASTG